MKRMLYLGSGVILVAGFLISPAYAQSDSSSLGDYARSVRKQQTQKPPATKHFDNDNLPKEEHLSVVGQPPAQAAQTPTDAVGRPENPQGADGAAADKKTDAASQKDDAAERQAQYEEWQKKIAQQKDQIDLLTRELDVLNREYRLRAAAMYADVGNRLRNAGQWDKEDADYKQKIADKQKALDAAKQKLDDMQEEARKSGVPSSMRE
jgi:hypothetical protein